jgi:hypothetical protein
MTFQKQLRWSTGKFARHLHSVLYLFGYSVSRIDGPGWDVSKLSFGASSLGSVFRDTDEDESIQVVRTALKNGRLSCRTSCPQVPRHQGGGLTM